MDQERYELVDVIGSGGMATVWHANDTRLGRVVALKRPHPAPPGSVELTRFAREARAAATVSHPHLVAVYDAGEDDLGPYLVMEFVDGPSLASGSPSGSVAALGAQIASALAALHAAGIVHGDVKPGNVLLSDGGAKLTDFGIARSAADTSALTQPGMALGTPAYAAPETIATGARTASADVYSLAALLHELVTGTRWSPASGATQALPPESWRPVLASALATDPARRPSAAALAGELAALELLADPQAATVPIGIVAGPPAVPAQPDGNRRAATAAVVVAILTIGAIGVAAWFEARGDDDLPSGVAASVVTEPGTPATVAAVGPVATTVAAETTVPTTVATTVATTVPPATPADLAGELVVLIDAAAPRELKPKEAREIADRIDDAVAAVAAGDLGKAQDQLRDAAERIERHVEDDATRAQAAELLATLSTAIGVDPAVVLEPFVDQQGGEGD